MKKSTKGFCMAVVLIIAAYLVLRWDYHLSSYMFNKICNDPERIGIFVYEHVSLGSNYFEKIENDINGIVGRRYMLDDESILKKDAMSSEYIINFRESEQHSKIGPVVIDRSTIYRRSDGKLLGEAVSVVSLKGWFAQVGTLSGTARIHCPGGQDDRGFWNYLKPHNELVRNVFDKIVKGEARNGY